MNLNLENQRVIHNDCFRTRAYERIIQPSFCEYAEYLLTFYCKEKKIKYKQGLNEIVGPFILLKEKINISFSRIYNLFSNFIEKFLTNFFLDDEFFSLQSNFSLINLLLLYHEPEIQNYLDICLLTPEMYSTNWLLTIFAK